MEAKYYKINVTCTGKPMGRTEEDYSCFDTFNKVFKTLELLKDWLKEQYGKCKRVKMYVDEENNKTSCTGYIFCFRNGDISHIPVQKWYQQDWVEISHIVENTIAL